MKKELIVESMALLFELVEEEDIVTRIRKGGKILLNARELGIRGDIYGHLSEIELENNKRIRRYYYNEVNKILTKMYMSA